MVYVRAAILESGVACTKPVRRTFDPRLGVAAKTSPLIKCFLASSGCRVTEKESREIAEKVGKALPGWVARPKRVVPKDVYYHPSKRDAEGNPVEFIEVHAWQ